MQGPGNRLCVPPPAGLHALDGQNRVPARSTRPPLLKWSGNRSEDRMNPAARGKGQLGQGNEGLVRVLREAKEPVPMASRRLRSRRSEEHTSELQSRFDLVCRLLL